MPLDWDAQHKDKAPVGVPRPELPSLQGIPDADHRLFLRMYLRSNLDKDQDEAKKRCSVYGVDYNTARQEAAG